MANAASAFCRIRHDFKIILGTGKGIAKIDHLPFLSKQA